MNNDKNTFVIRFSMKSWRSFPVMNAMKSFLHIIGKY